MSVSELTCLRHPPEKVVAFVRDLAEEYQTYSGPERRSQPRKSIVVPVFVQPLDENFYPVGDAFSAVTKDISGGGVGLLYHDAVTAKYLQIELTARDQRQMQLLAHVRHCTPCGESYHIGARFVVDWSLCRGNS